MIQKPLYLYLTPDSRIAVCTRGRVLNTIDELLLCRAELHYEAQVISFSVRQTGLKVFGLLVVVAMQLP
jgi:hypothetical protein